MSLILFDTPLAHKQLLPLTFTRPISEIRCGIFTIREKWERYFGKASWLTEDYLSEVFPCETEAENLYINASLLPSQEIVNQIKKLRKNEAIVHKEHILAFVSAEVKISQIEQLTFSKKTEIETAQLIERPWHIFQQNGNEIRKDFQYVIATEENFYLSDPHTIMYESNNIFIGKNVKIKASVLNAENGPIYIGDNCEIQEGSLIRGPFALCEGSTVNMGAKMRGDNTIGPHCKVGGEISNSILFGYSNKGHDGFLGNSVLGEWCNLGADTNTSNLKNNYSNVSIYSYAENGNVDTGSQFCGLTMGDHSKAGINTMFNTGTVVGVSANVFDGDFPAKHIPSFAWGKNEVYDFDKALETAKRVMERRGKSLSEAEVKVLRVVFENKQAL
jgi:UDP-N-acetylglucosamine diphosphorylase/glucosamine-1-phosphate N-acetyltransferase